MKQLLLLISFFILVISNSFTQNVNIGYEDRREIPVKGTVTDSDGDLILRSPSIQYLRAFICGDEITVNFLVPTTEVAIIISNAVTNEVICTQEYNSPDDVIIRLDIKDKGNYQIDFISEYWELQGEFDL